jgi:hypothetical protein
MDDLYPMLMRYSNPSIDDECVGKIGVIQERGLKARFIANPRLSYQVALMSLGDYLFRVLERLPWDCTFDQQKGALWCRDQLRHRRKVFCVDLSDATNNAPREQIMRILEWDENIPPPHITLFKEVSGGKWYVPANVRPRPSFSRGASNKWINQDHLRWTQGVPLGISPSFPAFALWHGLVVRSIEIRYKLKDTFRILGDDIVISNGLVY